MISTILGYRQVAGFATLVALPTFLLGVVIIILGIIGEYVLRISMKSPHTTGSRGR